jgi:choline dehydrogenase
MLTHRYFRLASVLAWALFPTPLSALPAGDTKNDTTVHDYVIIGSGAGGGTLAYDLQDLIVHNFSKTADKNFFDSASLARKGHSVFLIEAGGDHGTAVSQQIPAL